MKKNIVFSIIVFLCLILALSCESSPDSFRNSSQNSSQDGSGSVEIKAIDDVLVNMSALKNYKANISSTTAAIGIVSADSNTRGIDDYLDKILVKQEEGSTETEEVTFTVDKATNDYGNALIGFDGKNLKVGDVITQEEIPGKIDKLYVSGDYTFISYLTVDTYKLLNYKELSSGTNGDGTKYYNGSVNFNENNGNNAGSNESIWWNFTGDNPDCIYINWSLNKWWHDSDGNYKQSNVSTSETVYLRNDSRNEQAPGENSGVTVYDTYDYYTSMFRESFIIDNNTGLIYSLEDRKIGFQAGVPFDEELGPVQITSEDNGELLISPIVDNPNVYIASTFKDKYGQYYILNDSLEEKNENVVYYTKMNEYILADSGEAIHLIGSSVQNYSNGVYSISGIRVVGENFSERDVTVDDEFVFRSVHQYQSSYSYDYSNIIYKYNQKNNQKDYWQFQNYNSGFCSTFVSIRNGELVSYYCNNTLYISLTDITDYTTYCFYQWFNYNQIFLSLDNGYFLYGSKSDTGSLYNLKVIDLNDFDIRLMATYIVKSDGTISSRSDYDQFKLRYSEYVGTSFGYDSVLASSSDFYLTSNYRYSETEETIYDNDYTFYKREVIDTSTGIDEEKVKKSEAFRAVGEEKYVKNTGRIATKCYKYRWYENEKIGETEFGYDPNKKTDDTFYVRGEHRLGLKYYQQGTIYTYYDSSDNVISTTFDNYDDTISCDHRDSKYDWYYFENGILDYDYEYTWYKKKYVAETIGYNPEYGSNSSYKYETDSYGLYVPDYIQTCDYEYFNIIVVGTTFGFYPDSSWDYDYYEATSNHYTGTVKVEKWDSDYKYYKYKDGYDNAKIDSMWNKRDSMDLFDGTTVLEGINISSTSDYQKYTDAYDCTFSKQDRTGTITYQIVDNGNGSFEAVERSKVISERKTVTLQPINK